jgi:hypothetical protein
MLHTITCSEILLHLVAIVNAVVCVSLEPSCYRHFTYMDTFRTLVQLSYWFKSQKVFIYSTFFFLG